MLTAIGKQVLFVVFGNLAFRRHKVKTIKVICGKPRQEDPAILATLERKDSAHTAKEAQAEIYKKMRGQDFVVQAQAESFLDNLIFDNVFPENTERINDYISDEQVYRKIVDDINSIINEI